VSGAATITGNLTVDTNTLFVDATNDRVGIGTTSPTTNLEVVGGLNVSDGTSTLRFINSGGVGLIGTLSNHSLGIRTNNTQRIHITSGGNVGIGTTSPNASAILQTDSTTSGFLPPRMTEAQKNAIATPAAGLIIYQTDATKGLYLYDGTAWRALTMT
jgi:hypothetical protein